MAGRAQCRRIRGQKARDDAVTRCQRGRAAEGPLHPVKRGGDVGGHGHGIHLRTQGKKRSDITLVAQGAWSQYLEVGIGPDAEVFTKCQPLAAVGYGAEVGLHPASRWNNPEPEVVLAVDGRGVVRGATLGNDVNLRDVEGRSALLLGKAKDNNASAAIGPFVRLFDEGWGLDDVRRLELTPRTPSRLTSLPPRARRRR